MFTAKRKGLGQGWLMQATLLEAFSEDPSASCAQLNKAIEAAILIAPEQFIWAYNRFKHPLGAEPPPQ
jgi:KDO2-lipid IV(A) lauroyltransferase